MEIYRRIIDREKLNAVEMAFTGDDQVIKNISLKANGNGAPDTKTVVVMPGGAHRGVVQAGFGLAIEEMGVADGVDDFVGVSVGSAVGFYIVAREFEKGSTIFLEDNMEGGVFSLRRFPVLMDLEPVERALRETKALDLKNFYSSRQGLYVGVTSEKGQSCFVDVKKSEDPYEVVMASMSHPVYNGNKSKAIDGKQYYDGSLSNPLPISFAIEELEVTDILVVLTKLFSQTR